MTSEFLGVGWASPVRLDENGQIALARYEESVRQAIWMILGTARGERVMRPTFGCGIHDLVFATISGDDRPCGHRGASSANPVGAAHRHPECDCRRGQKRAQSFVDRNQIQSTTATNNQFNLVYPFYLE